MLLTTAPMARARKLEPWTKGLAAEARRNMFKVNGAIKRLRAYETTYAAMFDDIDVLMCPTTTGAAPRVGDLSPDQPFEAKREKLQREFLAMETALAQLQGQQGALLSMGGNLGF